MLTMNTIGPDSSPIVLEIDKFVSKALNNATAPANEKALPKNTDPKVLVG